jgi:hypothetical protein
MSKRKLLFGATIAFGVGWCAVSLGGERLTVAELASRAQGAVIVDVELGSAGNRGRIAVRRVITGVPGDIQADTAWLGLCTGTAERFRRWMHQHPDWEARALWRAGLKRRSYQAVLFIQPSRATGKLEPYCETEAMLMQHTSLHPDFAGYVKQVEAELARARETSR